MTVDVDGALEAMPIIADEMRARNMHVNAEVLDVVAAEVRVLREEVEQQRIQIEADDENLTIWKDLLRSKLNDPLLDYTLNGESGFIRKSELRELLK